MEVISSFRGENMFLSNFYQCPIEFEGLIYPNSEAAFHAQKCQDPADREKYTRVKNPVITKRMGRREKLPADWDERSYGIMESILRVKFANPALADKLLATGDAYLEEGNHWHDNRWGNCSCDACREIEGKNWLGKILMDIRENIKAA